LAHGFDVDPRLRVTGAFTEASGYEAGGRLLRQSPVATAIFAANDGMAIGLISRLHEAGIRVPEDIAVMGFDDIPTARYLAPPLSTVRVDAHGLGARSVACLLDLLASEDKGREIRCTIPWDLVVRRSCGALDVPEGAPQLSHGGSYARSRGREPRNL
jgi:LacI family transcriptional regulator